MDSPAKTVDRGGETSGGRRPPRPSKGRRRARLAAILGATIVLVAGWKAAPKVGRQVRIRLAERAIAAGRLGEAEARLDLLIAQEPGEARLRLLRVRVVRELGRITEAEEALQRAVELGLPVDQGRREFALLRAGRDFAVAKESLRRVLEAHPDDAEVRRALAEGSARLR